MCQQNARAWCVPGQKEPVPLSASVYIPTAKRLANQFAPGNRASDAARKCQWCARPANKGKPWCARHKPGRASDRRYQRNHAWSGLPTVAMETWIAKGLSPAFLDWPPIARVVAVRPMHTRPVRLAEIMQALLWQAAGHHEPWAALVSRMRAAGLYRDNDPSLAEYLANVG